MRMREAGLLTYWYLKGVPDVHQCIQTKKKGTIDDMNPVSLKGLTGAFFVLVFGYATSVLLFLGEKIYFLSLSKRNPRNQKLKIVKLQNQITE